MRKAQLIDGKTKAAEISAALKAETQALLTEYGIRPGLAVVIAGEDLLAVGVGAGGDGPRSPSTGRCR